MVLKGRHLGFDLYLLGLWGWRGCGGGGIWRGGRGICYVCVVWLRNQLALTHSINRSRTERKNEEGGKERKLRKVRTREHHSARHISSTQELWLGCNRMDRIYASCMSEECTWGPMLVVESRRSLCPLVGFGGGPLSLFEGYKYFPRDEVSFEASAMTSSVGCRGRTRGVHARSVYWGGL